MLELEPKRRPVKMTLGSWDWTCLLVISENCGFSESDSNSAKLFPSLIVLSRVGMAVKFSNAMGSGSEPLCIKKLATRNSPVLGLMTMIRSMAVVASVIPPIGEM